MQKYTLKRIVRILFLQVARCQMPGHLRAKFLKYGGVCIPNHENVSIGEGVIIDRLHPEDLTIGHHVRITMNCIILTHYFDVSKTIAFKRGKVNIGNYVFMGAGAIICNSVKIGDYAVIVAGAVVTKDIPPYEVWVGSPARFLKIRPGYEKQHKECMRNK